MTTEGPTPYLEANALLAVQAGDHVGLADALDQMLPGEIRALADSAAELARTCRDRARMARMAEMVAENSTSTPGI